MGDNDKYCMNCYAPAHPDPNYGVSQERKEKEKSDEGEDKFTLIFCCSIIIVAFTAYALLMYWINPSMFY